jgi:hypothetical protein
MCCPGVFWLISFCLLLQSSSLRFVSHDDDCWFALNDGDDIHRAAPKKGEDLEQVVAPMPCALVPVAPVQRGVPRMLFADPTMPGLLDREGWSARLQSSSHSQVIVVEVGAFSVAPRACWVVVAADEEVVRVTVVLCEVCGREDPGFLLPREE